MEQQDWVRMIKDARKSDQGFEELLGILKPKLDMLSHLICVSRFQDDALQMAKINIWKTLKKVDIKNGTNIESYLLKGAYNAMCSWLAKCQKTSPEVLETDGSEQMNMVTVPSERDLLFDYIGTLGLYLEYIKNTGSFYKAHTNIAKSLGISVRSARRNFRAAVKEFISKYNL